MAIVMKIENQQYQFCHPGKYHFTEPFKEPIEYGRYVARLANMLSGGVVIQRLKDLQLGRRSTPERIKKSV